MHSFQEPPPQAVSGHYPYPQYPPQQQHHHHYPQHFVQPHNGSQPAGPPPVTFSLAPAVHPHHQHQHHYPQHFAQPHPGSQLHPSQHHQHYPPPHAHAPPPHHPPLFASHAIYQHPPMQYPPPHFLVAPPTGYPPHPYYLVPQMPRTHASALAEDYDSEEWYSTSSEEGELGGKGRGKGRKRRKKRKNRRPRPLRKKPLPEAEATLEAAPITGGGVPGPLAEHQGFAGWKSALHDVHRRSFVSHRKKAFTPETLKSWWKTLETKIDWKRPERPPKEGGGKEREPGDELMPRSAAWLTTIGCRCEYQYGGMSFPPAHMPDWFLEITDKVCRSCGLKERPNSCNANLYRTGAQSVSWHSDDEPLFDATGRDSLIVSLSLGATRSFELRPKDDPFQQTILELEDGDLCTMEGLCQKHYRHRVPSQEEVEGARINLTWRWVVQHDTQCPQHRRSA